MRPRRNPHVLAVRREVARLQRVLDEMDQRLAVVERCLSADGCLSQQRVAIAANSVDHHDHHGVDHDHPEASR